MFNRFPKRGKQKKTIMKKNANEILCYSTVSNAIRQWVTGTMCQTLNGKLQNCLQSKLP